MRRFIIAMILCLPVAAQAQDKVSGEKLFKMGCSACHSPQPGQTVTGPSLFGIVDRPSAQMANYKYSEAMRSANLTWTSETLERYLPAPQQLVPGTTMRFPGLKDAKQRADLVAYLQTLH
jgi:cytochrome c